MIPKVIHYCWFGGKQYPRLVKKCIRSWIKLLPDYTIKCWNEESFDIDSAPIYVREAFKMKKYAFAKQKWNIYNRKQEIL